MSQLRTTSRVTAALLAAVATLAATSATAAARTVTVTASGRAVSLKPGDRLVVDVAENPSTGYAWRTLARPAVLALVSSRYTPDPAPPGVVGGGGHRLFTYRATRAGRGTLLLVYRRSFAPRAGDRRFTVKVSVAG